MSATPFGKLSEKTVVFGTKGPNVGWWGQVVPNFCKSLFYVIFDHYITLKVHFLSGWVHNLGILPQIKPFFGGLPSCSCSHPVIFFSLEARLKSKKGFLSYHLTKAALISGNSHCLNHIMYLWKGLAIPYHTIPYHAILSELHNVLMEWQLSYPSLPYLWYGEASHTSAIPYCPNHIICTYASPPSCPNENICFDKT